MRPLAADNKSPPLLGKAHEHLVHLAWPGEFNRLGLEEQVVPEWNGLIRREGFPRMAAGPHASPDVVRIKGCQRFLSDATGWISVDLCIIWLHAWHRVK
ncbi:hypothetical protein [Acidisphaera sp. S103]|uniref:hypothetical protein n=1 Tax=Acidisphaera sp. S103 TaxID=1747223 RepID=UPI00131DF95F|nr:hypothetical protein [Acidisphaera sp. S103]